MTIIYSKASAKFIKSTDKNSKYFNKKYNYVGYLHQDRFHADRVQDSSHLLTVSRYIHLNPVAANMVEVPNSIKVTIE